MATPRICSIPDCGKSQLARGWCNKHLRRWQRHGDPLGGGTFYGKPLRFFNEVVLAYSGDECLIWPFVCSKGYGRLTYKGKIQTVSRLVCEALAGPPPTPKHDAAHSCGKGHLGCVSPRHLRWATRTENLADALLHGTRLRGDRHPTAKLTNAQAEEVLSLKGVMLQREIAERFGISQMSVSRIHLRITYNA